MNDWDFRTRCCGNCVNRVPGSDKDANKNYKWYCIVKKKKLNDSHDFMRNNTCDSFKSRWRTEDVLYESR